MNKYKSELRNTEFINKKEMRVIDYVFKIVIMSFGILFSQFIFSQENFTTGYVIKLNGDSISGYVDYRNWEINPTKIIFKDKL